jgi:Mrp family chromosome partitioning ATPase
MERIARALELARAQRDGRAELRPGAHIVAHLEPHVDPQVDVVHERSAIASSHAANIAKENALHAASFAQEKESATLRSPLVELSPEQRERERILPPGSNGPLGGPYKMLRTQVMKRLDQLQVNSLAVVSAAAGAGKTLTAINLAIAIASDAGRTALLVDFDLRNPNIHRRFGFEPTVGIEDCLASGLPIREAMFRVAGYERLTILVARHPIENSSELLRSQHTIDAMTEMCARYADRVLIFDLPPALQADDALAFSRFVQAGLMVVGERRTKREDVGRTLELLHELPIVGTVLNGSHDDSRVHY